MPGAAAKSLRMTAASPSRSSPLSHDSNTHIGFQRDAWQVLFQGSASGINTVEARCQGVGRFALRIPDESIGTRALPTCPDRRQQVAQQSGQPYLGFRYLELQPRHGPAGGGHLPTVVAVRISVRGAQGRDSLTGRMWKCGVLVSGPGELAPECWFTLRSAGIPVPDDRLLRHRIHTDADFAGPAPGEVGVIPGRSRRPLSGRCLCLSALGVMTTGAAATFLAPSATTGNVGEWTPAARRRFRVFTAF